MPAAKKLFICQFKVTLQRIEPAIWRRILVLGAYSCWHLHVAIQDAMGWLDCHLHVFHVQQKRRSIRVGFPTEWDETAVRPSWEVPISRCFKEPGQVVAYEYDFGDSWQPEILLEAILPMEKNGVYPKCIDGARACPPEDCGGISGYYRLLEILRDPNHPEYEETMKLLRTHLKNYLPYDPDKFDPNSVRFDDPLQRLLGALNGWSEGA